MGKKLAKRGKTRRQRPKLLRKAVDAADSLLDQVIDDPEKFFQKIERGAGHAVRGIDRLVEAYERDPARARREVRDFIAQNLARYGKKRLRAAR